MHKYGRGQTNSFQANRFWESFCLAKNDLFALVHFVCSAHISHFGTIVLVLKQFGLSAPCVREETEDPLPRGWGTKST